jgi:predicted nucleic acid-binding protein
VSDYLVFDTSVIFNLGYRSGGGGEIVVEHLRKEYSLLLPPEVKKEVLRDPSVNFDHAAFLKNHFKVRSVNLPSEYEEGFRRISKDLDSGEIAVLNLGLALKSKVVIDEKRARRAAKELTLFCTGSIGLFNEAVERKWIEAAFALSTVTKIIESGGHLPPIGEAKKWQEYVNSISPLARQQH